VLYSNTNSLEDRIVELATNARISIKSLHAELRKEGDLSLRAVYKAVHKLVGAGVLLKVGKQVMIDQEWAKRVGEMLDSASAPFLSTGERAVYTFVSVEHLDAFWKTVMLPLEHSISAREIFFYNPHNFWAYLPARKESEDAYYRHFSDTEHHGFFTVGGDSVADAEFKRKYQGEYLQIDLRNIVSFRRTDHVTIIGPIVITVRLAKGVSERIDKLYASGENVKEILPEIVNICQKPGKIRFILENNATKAAKVKKVLARNFYFKKTE
jgi:DNA-binding Lrp family transcriptional regulator